MRLKLRLGGLQVGLSPLHVGFRTIDLFGPRSALQFLLSALALPSYDRLRLIVLSAVFAIFEPHDDLICA